MTVFSSQRAIDSSSPRICRRWISACSSKVSKGTIDDLEVGPVTCTVRGPENDPVDVRFSRYATCSQSSLDSRMNSETVIFL